MKILIIDEKKLEDGSVIKLELELGAINIESHGGCSCSSCESTATIDIKGYKNLIGDSLIKDKEVYHKDVLCLIGYELPKIWELYPTGATSEDLESNLLARREAYYKERKAANKIKAAKSKATREKNKLLKASQPKKKTRSRKDQEEYE